MCLFWFRDLGTCVGMRKPCCHLLHFVTFSPQTPHGSNESFCHNKNVTLQDATEYFAILTRMLVWETPMCCSLTPVSPPMQPMQGLTKNPLRNPWGTLWSSCSVPALCTSLASPALNPPPSKHAHISLDDKIGHPPTLPSLQSRGEVKRVSLWMSMAAAGIGALFSFCIDGERGVWCQGTCLHHCVVLFLPF